MKNKDPEFYKKFYFNHLYNRQRKDATRRNVSWEITFEEWYDWWGDDIENRGPYKGQLVMARHNDTGPYKLGNISKLEAGQNARDGRTGKPASKTGKTIRLRRKVLTPDGIFPSINDAAKHYSVTSHAIRYYVQSKPNEFKFMGYIKE